MTFLKHLIQNSRITLALAGFALWHGRDKYNCREEIDLFNRIGVTYIEPEFRNT